VCIRVCVCVCVFVCLRLYRFGRRRPFILFLTPIYACALTWLFLPTKSTAAYTFVIAYGLMSITSQPINTMYNALGTELTQHDDQRRALFTWSNIGELLGVLCTSIVIGVVGLKNEVSRHCNNRFRHSLTQVCLRSFLHFGEYTSTNLTGRVLFAMCF